MAHSEAFLKLVDESRAKIKEYTVDEVKAKMDAGESFVLIDVREQDEWQKDRIQSAIYIGKGVLERDIEKHVQDKSAEVILYCGGGFRSAISAELIQKMGYTNVSSMDGGIREWRSKEYPMTS